MARVRDVVWSGRDALVVFARYPTPGLVKTRLGREIGDEAAATLYRAFLTDLAARFASPPFAVRWAIAPPDLGLADLLGLEPEACWVQSAGNLGDRMHAAFVAMLGAGFERCAIIGSDMPQLAVSTVKRALEMLGESDVVLGPTEDGGYYLIGMTGLHDLFGGIPWGAPQVFEATTHRATRLGLRIGVLERGFDVDVRDDLQHLSALLKIPGQRDAMTATASALDAIRVMRG